MRIAPALLALALGNPVLAHTHAHAARTPQRLAQHRATAHAPAPTHAVAAHPAPAPAPAHATAPSPTATVTAASVAQGIQSFYDRTNDWDSEFTQRTRTALIDQSRTGHVTFRKPGRMRWEYSNPTGDLIVCDGVTVSTYDAAAHQMIQVPLQQSQMPSALSFLTGHGSLVTDFTPRLVTQGTPAGIYRLELTPHTPTPSVSHLVFDVDPATFQVERVFIADANNNRTTFEFRTPRVNTSPAATLFQFTPPRGTSIVRP